MLTEIYKKVHFIGIGGVSLSSLALYLVKNGVRVTGSDRAYSDTLINLSENGCDVWVGSCPEKIKNPDLVVYSSAIKPDDPELVFCKNAGIKCLERNLFLGLLCDDFKCCIAISGTHGKTTVTSMLIKIFHEAEKSFFGHVGGETEEFGNSYFSGNDYFVTEACEYKKSFLSLKPKIAVVLNAETDHPDTYENIEEIYDTFEEFLIATRKNSGLGIVNGDSEFYRKKLSESDVVTYGLGEQNRFRADQVYEHKKGFKGFLIYDYGTLIGHIRLNIAGEHNVMNALCAFAVSSIVGIPSDIICKALNDFRGVKRRFEYVCKYRGSDVYTDYAHHPSEIKAVIATAKDVSDGPLIVLFQPHTYSRTAKLYNEFIQCFDGADKLVIIKEYPARETPTDGKSARELYFGVDHNDKTYCETILDAIVLLNDQATPNDTILILGAGDIVNICKIIKS